MNIKKLFGVLFIILMLLSVPCAYAMNPFAEASIAGANIVITVNSPISDVNKIEELKKEIGECEDKLNKLDKDLQIKVNLEDKNHRDSIFNEYREASLMLNQAKSALKNNNIADGKMYVFRTKYHINHIELLLRI